MSGILELMLMFGVVAAIALWQIVSTNREIEEAGARPAARSRKRPALKKRRRR